MRNRRIEAIERSLNIARSTINKKKLKDELFKAHFSCLSDYDFNKLTSAQKVAMMSDEPRINYKIN